MKLIREKTYKITRLKDILDGKVFSFNSEYRQGNPPVYIKGSAGHAINLCTGEEITVDDSTVIINYPNAVLYLDKEE